jgi:hypothetical protein
VPVKVSEEFAAPVRYMNLPVESSYPKNPKEAEVPEK